MYGKKLLKCFRNAVEVSHHPRNKLLKLQKKKEMVFGDLVGMCRVNQRFTVLNVLQRLKSHPQAFCYLMSTVLLGLRGVLIHDSEDGQTGIPRTLLTGKTPITFCDASESKPIVRGVSISTLSLSIRWSSFINSYSTSSESWNGYRKKRGKERANFALSSRQKKKKKKKRITVVHK